MARDTHRVLPREDGKWAVKRDGDSKASHLTDKKVDAERIARQISTNQGTELQIHNKDGRISRSDSHGNDPCPPKDKA